MKKIILCLCLFVIAATSIYAQSLKGVLDIKRGQPGISTISSLVAISVNAQTDRDLGAGSYAIYKGSTPLIVASTLGYTDVVRALIDSGASVNMKDTRGYTALIRAANRDVADLLIKNNANINDKNNYGFTPLMYSASVGRSDVAKVLIDNRAQINDVQGIWSPLIIASYRNKVEVVNLLINSGAQVELKNSQGNIAFDYAQTDAMKDALYRYAFERSYIEQPEIPNPPVVTYPPVTNTFTPPVDTYIPPTTTPNSRREIVIIEDDPATDPRAKKAPVQPAKKTPPATTTQPATKKVPAVKKTSKATTPKTATDPYMFFENYEDGYLAQGQTSSMQAKAYLDIPSMK